MSQIVEVKAMIKNSDLRTILAISVYNPTNERLINLADQYIANPNIEIYAMKENDIYKGVVVIGINNIKAIEILNIAVSTSFQKLGIGSSLINHVIDLYHPDKMIAETDDDAVEFYGKKGFHIMPLGDKHGSGRMRYQCALEC